MAERDCFLSWFQEGQGSVGDRFGAKPRITSALYPSSTFALRLPCGRQCKFESPVLIYLRTSHFKINYNLRFFHSHPQEQGIFPGLEVQGIDLHLLSHRGHHLIPEIIFVV